MFYTLSKKEAMVSTKQERSEAARLLGQKGGQTVTPKKLRHLRKIAKLGGWPKGRPRGSRKTHKES